MRSIGVDAAIPNTPQVDAQANDAPIIILIAEKTGGLQPSIGYEHRESCAAVVIGTRIPFAATLNTPPVMR